MKGQVLETSLMIKKVCQAEPETTPKQCVGGASL